MDKQTEIFRLMVRRFGNFNWRLGRSGLKKKLRRKMSDRQVVEVLPGLRLQFDLSIRRQEFDFWFHEEDDKPLQEAIMQLMPAGGVFVDVGANYGFFSHYAAWAKQARVHAFEPLPRLAELIRQNAQLNSFGSLITVHEKAVSEKPGKAFLKVASLRHDGSHRVLPEEPAEADASLVGIEVTTLAAFFEAGTLEKIDFLKIDAEGYDHAVLTGLGDHLKPEKVGLIYMEMKGHHEESSALLRARGYKGFDSHRLFVDEIRRYNDSHDALPLFLPAGSLNRDMLWCPENSAACSIIQRQADYWAAQSPFLSNK